MSTGNSRCKTGSQVQSSRVLAWFFAGAVSFSSLTVLAAETPETKAKALFDVGGRAYDNGEFDVALQAFEQAHAIYPKDSLLFSMAQAHRRLFAETKEPRSRDEALRLFREYLVKVKAGSRRAEANKLVGELEATSAVVSSSASQTKKKTRLFVASGTPAVTVSIDGGAATLANRTIEITPGKHSLTLQAPGFVAQKLEVDAAPDEVLPISRDLVEMPAKLEVDTTGGASLSIDGRFVGDAPLSAPLDVAAGEHFIAVELAGHQTRSKTVTLARGKREALDLSLAPTTQRYLSFAFIGIASATAVASGIFTGMAFVAESDARAILEKQQASGLETGDLASYEDARSQRDRFVLGAGISGGAAGALLITGLALYLVDPAERAVPPPKPNQPAPKPGAPSAIDADDVTLVPLVSPEVVGVLAGLRF